MPSIFSRARTASTPSKSKHKPPLTVSPPSLPVASNSLRSPPRGPTPTDEFGRTRSSSLGVAGGGVASAAASDSGYGAVGFLPTTLPADLAIPFSGFNTPAPSAAGQPPPPPPSPRAAYGLLSPARDAVLGLPDAARLVGRVCAALSRSGPATPFVFSALALDVRRGGVVRLVHAFLATCKEGAGAGAEEKWAEEAQFAGPHELAMCLRWGLSRVVRVEGGREVRGLLSWAWYERWKSEESANAYPANAFSALLSSLPAQLPAILTPLFDLCTRLVAHSNASGHTPPSLAAVLSPLLFGLAPPAWLAPAPPTPSHATPNSKAGKEQAAEDVLFPTVEDFSAFGVAYEEYLRGARAAEHLVLASIREEVLGGGGGLGAPTRLKEWIGMYTGGVEGKGARRGAKTVRVVHVRRNVRSYTADLVRGGSSWASGAPNDWANSKAWRAIIAGGAGAPRYTETYRKRMDLGVGVHPSTSSLQSSLSASSGTGSYFSSPSSYNLASGSSTSLSDDGSAFRSLTDMKWGEFESLGFGSSGGATGGGGGMKEGGIEGRLRFDLTENARAERLTKRETLSWNDFSTAGFSRSDAPLSATLQFSPPLTLMPPSPSAPLNAEMTRKLRKAQKALPAFGWDTTPVLGPEEVVEEAFLDVFCDLLWGGGWMERAAGVGGPTAELARECSWALVEYKSRTGAQLDSGSTVVLFEEFVPREYRLALVGVAPPGTRRRLPSLFSPAPANGGKPWKQAPTLNGRPYVVGSTPALPNTSGAAKFADFDSMLRTQNDTKQISLGGLKRGITTNVATVPAIASPTAGPLGIARTPSVETQESSDGAGAGAGGGGGGKRLSGARFRLPGGIIPGPSPGIGGRVRAGMAPAEYAAVEFETRLAGESDDEGEEEEAAKQRRRESTSDAWVDILVGSVQARRMGGQDAEMPRGSARRRAGFVNGPDPDLASMEVAQALAAETMGRALSPERDDDARLRDSDVSEIERVPRTSEQTDRSEEDYPISEDGYGPPTDGEDAEEESLTPGKEVHPLISARQEARQQRRLGYFDIHPERRPASVATTDDDPRSLLSGSDSDDEHDVVITTARNLDIRPLPTPSKSAGPSPVSPVDFPEFDDTAHQRRAEHESGGRSKTDSAILSPSANGNGHAIVSPKPAAASKTSALIDMFREREQGRSGSPAKPAGPAPIPASRLPVRTASREALPASTSPSNALPKTPPGPAAAPLPQAPAPKSTPPLLDPAAIQPPPPLSPDSGRASPARYVHGAPLHNVLEEEEEET
ncbi:hypothetical protein B0H15DRAFT_862667 [Mycena belliarum]|uniref:Meiotically up-regulated protein Msb1/Mug8 domain-containing protein n=1 Tax=Mycena belliarum TaxID=1033014 RepID=A0AAD6TWQ2_9AGAR|nr:hypothetical protein B0H15DRAFT_862667 [Mycena belliae]